MENTKWDVTHLKELIDTNKIVDAKEYITRFFFKYKKDVFHYDGKVFTLYKIQDLTGLIPNDLIRYEAPKNVVFSANVYMKSTEFYAKLYDITIDFSEKILFEQKGIKFLNMAKPFNVSKDNKVKTKSVQKELQLVYAHILNIWCSKNQALYEWIMNFIACTLCGRKLLMNMAVLGVWIFVLLLLVEELLLTF